MVSLNSCAIFYSCVQQEKIRRSVLYRLSLSELLLLLLPLTKTFLLFALPPSSVDDEIQLCAHRLEGRPGGLLPASAGWLCLHNMCAILTVPILWRISSACLKPDVMQVGTNRGRRVT